jgi:parvulin-like peptidyl-prolyl isomerase
MPQSAYADRLIGRLLLAVIVILSANHVAVAQDIVAEVNGRPISRQIFQAYYRFEVNKFAKAGNPINEAYLRDLRRHLIDSLVESELLLQEAQRHGIKISDEVLNQEIDNDRAQFAGEEQFQADIRSYGIEFNDYRNIRRRKLTIERLITEHIAPEAVVSDADIRAFYRQHAERFRVPEQLHIRHITLRFPRDATDDQKAQVHERIVAIQQQIEGGRDFAELAREYSEDPSRQQGGDAGFKTADQVARTFGQAVLDLPAGHMSPPIETPLGYHLVIVAERRPGRTIPLARVQAQIRQNLYRQQTRKPIQAHIKQLRANARIVIHE